MSNHERVFLGLTLIRVSVFVLYALAGAICYRRLYARLSPFCGRLAAGMLFAHAAVIFLAIPQHPSSVFDQWLWDVHEEGNIPATLASAQLALVASAALITAWLARARPGWQRLYLLGIGLIFLFVARDEYVSLHERIDNWERYYMVLGVLVAAATAYVAYRSARDSRIWYLCMLVGLAMSATGAIPLESNPLFCGRWDFLPLDGCHWTHHYEESLEFLGIWLVLLGLLGQLSEAAPAPGRSLRAALLALMPLWILLLMLGSLMPRLELPFLANPSDVQFESRLRLRGYRIDQGAEVITLWLYAASRTPDYLDQGYSVHIVDQDSGAALASWDAPVAGEVRIKVHACALNWLDVGIRRGPQFGAVPLPLTTGVDISGVVDVLGAGASGWQVGDEVTLYSLVTCGDCEYCRAGEVTVCPEHQIIGEHMNGGLAEYMLAPARNLIAKPRRLSHIETAALPVVAGTAWHMLITVARLAAGESVFIPGAGGGVASMGIQIAKQAGATVIASTSTAEKMAKARQLGADHVVNYRDDDWVEQVIALTGGRGVDVAQDLVGALTWADSLRTLARNGRMVVCGSHSGKQFDLRIPQIYHRQLSILGANGATYNELRRVLELADQGALRPVIDRVLPLDQIREGHRILEAHDHFGKVVMHIAASS